MYFLLPGASLKVVHKSSQFHLVLTAVALQKSSSIGLGLFEICRGRPPPPWLSSPPCVDVGLGLFEPLLCSLESPAEPQRRGLVMVTPWACAFLDRFSTVSLPTTSGLEKITFDCFVSALSWQEGFRSRVWAGQRLVEALVPLPSSSRPEVEGSNFISLFLSDRNSLFSVVRSSNIFSAFCFVIVSVPEAQGPLLTGLGGKLGEARGSHK